MHRFFLSRLSQPPSRFPGAISAGVALFFVISLVWQVHFALCDCFPNYNEYSNPDVCCRCGCGPSNLPWQVASTSSNEYSYANTRSNDAICADRYDILCNDGQCCVNRGRCHKFDSKGKCTSWDSNQCVNHLKESYGQFYNPPPGWMRLDIQHGAFVCDGSGGDGGAAQNVSLVGLNGAWFSYDHDFYDSDGATTTSFQTLFTTVQGNMIRFFLHPEGIQLWQANEFVDIESRYPSFISNLVQVADLAAESGKWLLICLWNALEINNSDVVKSVLTDSAALESYVTNILRPVVNAIAFKPSVVIDIVNEPEGVCCSDGAILRYHESKAPRPPLSMNDLRRVVNRIAHEIKLIDRSMLVTVGSQWMNAISSNQNLIDSKHDWPLDLYSDFQLLNAGDGRYPLGKLDFLSVHCYWAYLNNGALTASPPGSSFDVSTLSVVDVMPIDQKPVLVSEFSSIGYEGFLKSSPNRLGDLIRTILGNGYAGALIWQWNQQNPSDPHDSQPTIQAALSK